MWESKFTFGHSVIKDENVDCGQQNENTFDSKLKLTQNWSPVDI